MSFHHTPHLLSGSEVHRCFGSCLHYMQRLPHIIQGRSFSYPLDLLSDRTIPPSHHSFEILPSGSRDTRIVASDTSLSDSLIGVHRFEILLMIFCGAVGIGSFRMHLDIFKVSSPTFGGRPILVVD